MKQIYETCNGEAEAGDRSLNLLAWPLSKLLISGVA